MKTRMGSSAHGEPVDRAVYGPMAADESHIADEVERGKLVVVLDGHCDGPGDRCKANLVSLAQRKKGHREGEWARKGQMR